jgi:hypothetical protein
VCPAIVALNACPRYVYACLVGGATTTTQQQQHRIITTNPLFPPSTQALPPLKLTAAERVAAHKTFVNDPIGPVFYALIYAS